MPLASVVDENWPVTEVVGLNAVKLNWRPVNERAINGERHREATAKTASSARSKFECAPLAAVRSHFE